MECQNETLWKKNWKFFGGKNFFESVLKSKNDLLSVQWKRLRKFIFHFPPLSLALSCFLTPSRSRSFALTHTLSCWQTAQAYVFAHTRMGYPSSHTPTPTHTQTHKKIPIVVASIQGRVLNLSGFISPQIAIWLSVMVPRTCLDGLPSRVTVLPSATLYP